MLPKLIDLPFPKLESSAGTLLTIVALLLLTASVFALIHDRLRSAALGAVGVALLALFALLHWDESMLVGALPLRSHGVLLAVALIGGSFVALREMERQGGNTALGRFATTAAVIAGLFAARAGYLWTDADARGGAWSLLALRQGGLMLIPGLIAGLGTAFGLLRSNPAELWRWCDAAALPLPASGALVSLGCYLHGSDYGVRLANPSPTWLSRLGTFPRWPSSLEAAYGSGAPAWFDQVAGGALGPESTSALAVHPIQLYETALMLALATVAVVMSRRRRFSGELAAAVLIPLLATKFFLEFLRGEPTRGLLGPAVVPALACGVFAGLMFGGPAVWLWARRRLSFRELRATLLAGMALGLAAWGGVALIGGEPTQLSLTQWISAGATPVLVSLWAWQRFSPQISV